MSTGRELEAVTAGEGLASEPCRRGCRAATRRVEAGRRHSGVRRLGGRFCCFVKRVEESGSLHQDPNPTVKKLIYYPKIIRMITSQSPSIISFLSNTSIFEGKETNDI